MKVEKRGSSEVKKYSVTSSLTGFKTVDCTKDIYE